MNCSAYKPPDTKTCEGLISQMEEPVDFGRAGCISGI